MDLGKSLIVIMWTVGPDEVAAGDACFQSHGKWMEGHSRQGDTALLDYSISKGPDLASPRRRIGFGSRPGSPGSQALAGPWPDISPRPRST